MLRGSGYKDDWVEGWSFMKGLISQLDFRASDGIQLQGVKSMKAGEIK